METILLLTSVTWYGRHIGLKEKRVALFRTNVQGQPECQSSSASKIIFFHPSEIRLLPQKNKLN